MQSWLARLTLKRSASKWRGSKPRLNASNSSTDHSIMLSTCIKAHTYYTETVALMTFSLNNMKHVFLSYAVVPMGTLCTMDSFCICWQLQTESGL